MSKIVTCVTQTFQKFWQRCTHVWCTGLLDSSLDRYMNIHYSWLNSQYSYHHGHKDCCHMHWFLWRKTTDYYYSSAEHASLTFGLPLLYQTCTVCLGNNILPCSRFIGLVHLTTNGKKKKQIKKKQMKTDKFWHMYIFFSWCSSKKSEKHGRFFKHTNNTPAEYCSSHHLKVHILIYKPIEQISNYYIQLAHL